MIAEAAEFLDIVGLDGNYIAYHCLKRVDAVDRPHLEEYLKQKYADIEKHVFVPALRRSAIGAADMFLIPESPFKRFVSQRFKDVYDREGLTGLDFKPVTLT
jgi:hypothetical protein